jgi:hypothetical protein
MSKCTDLHISLNKCPEPSFFTGGPSSKPLGTLFLGVKRRWLIHLFTLGMCSTQIFKHGYAYATLLGC